VHSRHVETGVAPSRSVPLAPRQTGGSPLADQRPRVGQPPRPRCVWPGLQDGSARALARRVRARAAPELRGRACVASGLPRLVRADLDGRGHRRRWEVVEATAGRPLLAEAKAGPLGGSGDLADAIEFEVRESEVVGRACAGERLPQQPVPWEGVSSQNRSPTPSPRPCARRQTGQTTRLRTRSDPGRWCRRASGRPSRGRAGGRCR
jgi:hypothetical protein